MSAAAHDHEIEELHTEDLHADENLFGELLGRAGKVKSPESRFLVLCNLLPHAGAARDEVLREALKAARPTFFSRGILSLAFFMERASLDERREVAQLVFRELRTRFSRVGHILEHLRRVPPDEADSVWYQYDVGAQSDLATLRDLLFPVGPYLTNADAEEALSLIPWYWSGGISALLPSIESPSRRAEILAEAHRLARSQTGANRGVALADLVSHVPPADRSAAVSEVLAAAGRYQQPGGSATDNRSTVLFRVAAYLAPEHLPRMISLAIETFDSAPTNLSVFVARLPEALRSLAIDRLLEGASGDAGIWWVIALWANVPRDRLARAVEAAGTSAPRDRNQLTSLSAAAKSLSESQLERAFAIVRLATRTGHSRPHDPVVHALGAISAELLRRSPAHREMVWSVVDEILRSRAGSRDEILDAIAGLAPAIRELGGPHVGDYAARGILEVGGWWS